MEEHSKTYVEWEAAGSGWSEGRSPMSGDLPGTIQSLSGSLWAATSLATLLGDHNSFLPTFCQQSCLGACLAFFHL